jgi:uncharacterized protein (UPF0548 family)
VEDEPARTRPLPFLLARDFHSRRIGRGEAAFQKACRAFEGWIMFDLGWVRVANASTRIAAGEVVVVEARTLGLWTLNVSRILEVTAGTTRFGFVYGTTALHLEEGEERFLLTLDTVSGDVTYP